MHETVGTHSYNSLRSNQRSLPRRGNRYWVVGDMLDLAKHIVNQKAGHFEPDKFEDQYETALLDLINQKRAGKPITAKARPRGENVVDLMDALRKSIGGGAATATEAPRKAAKKP